MREKLLDYITCPNCKGSFNLIIDIKNGLHIMKGQLDCESCKSSYLIKEGIPRLLDEKKINDLNKITAERFGHEWAAFDFITDQYEAQFLDWIYPVNKDFFKDKIVLDGGCGKARHSLLSSQFGAKEVIGIDLANGSVEAAFKNTSEISNIHIIQADIYNLPFKNQTFDYIYSIGVLHHTPDPKLSFSCLIKKIKNGGRISAWVYGREGNWWIIYILNPIREMITSKIPLPITRSLAFVLSFFLQILLKFVYKPINEKQFLKPLSKLIFYNDYMYNISKFSFKENYSIVFDHLLPEIAFYIKKEEFQSWFYENNLNNIQISWRNKNSWRGTADKEQSQ